MSQGVAEKEKSVTGSRNESPCRERQSIQLAIGISEGMKRRNLGDEALGFFNTTRVAILKKICGRKNFWRYQKNKKGGGNPMPAIPILVGVTTPWLFSKGVSVVGISWG